MRHLHPQPCPCDACRPSPAMAELDCVHRGESLGIEPCSTCPGHVELKVYACAVLGQCTIAEPLEGYAVCKGCSQYRGPS